MEKAESATESPAACPNCSQRFEPGAAPRFCPACGQETRVRAPTLGEFLQQFGGAYLSTEGALWRTLRLLLLRPGELTRRYLAGQRKHYVLPLRLYLTISVLVLLSIRLATQVAFDAPAPLQINGSTDAAAVKRFSFSMGGSRAGVQDGVFFCRELPQWVCQRLQRRFDHDPKGLQRELLAVGERIVSHVGSTLFVMLPAFALWLKLAWWNRRLRYTEHLVFALHLHAFWFLALALWLPGWDWLGFAAVCAMPVYTMLAIKVVYGGGLAGRLLRAGLVSVLYAITFALVMAALALWALLG